MYNLQPVAIVRSCFKEKFGIPRQAGLVPDARATIEVLPPFNDPQAFAELAECSHIWLQFVFHENKHYQWQPRVRPPRLGGNKTLGVFASRSPYRPNALGLSAVKLEKIDYQQGQLKLIVCGADLLDGTPVLDIKPYVPYADCLPQAVNPIAQQEPNTVMVEFTDDAARFCENYQRREKSALHELIRQVLAQDPRPQYHAKQADKIYGCRLQDVNVRWRFCVDGAREWIEVIAIEALT